MIKKHNLFIQALRIIAKELMMEFKRAAIELTQNTQMDECR
jgi:hypothetical protein